MMKNKKEQEANTRKLVKKPQIKKATGFLHWGVPNFMKNDLKVFVSSNQR